MMAEKWTPGPWRSMEASPYHANVVKDLSLGYVKIIATLMEHREHDVANARLIAAAPELYRAVKLLLSAVDHLAGPLGQGWQSQDASAEGQDACDFAERALAKAEGKTE